MQTNFKSAIAVASTAAALCSMGAVLTTATTAHAADTMSGKSTGVNSCNGTADCLTT